MVGVVITIYCGRSTRTLLYISRRVSTKRLVFRSYSRVVILKIIRGSIFRVERGREGVCVKKVQERITKTLENLSPELYHVDHGLLIHDI